MDIKQLAKCLEQAAGLIQGLDMNLVDLDDPLLQALGLQVGVVAATSTIDGDSAKTVLFLGYIAGRLRGRKEAIMAGMLRTEGDDGS